MENRSTMGAVPDAYWLRKTNYIAFYLQYLGVICAIGYNDFSLCLSSPPLSLLFSLSLASAFTRPFFFGYSHFIWVVWIHTEKHSAASECPRKKQFGTLGNMMNGHWTLWVLDAGKAACITLQFISLVEEQNPRQTYMHIKAHSWFLNSGMQHVQKNQNFLNGFPAAICALIVQTLKLMA